MSSSSRCSLVSEIQRVKDYSQHRIRLHTCSNASPCGKTKPSISFDLLRRRREQEIKLRIACARQYQQWSHNREIVEKDRKMLGRMYSYEQNPIRTSFREHKPQSPLLHHNSQTLLNRTNRLIQTDNIRIHAMISTVKSTVKSTSKSTALRPTALRSTVKHTYDRTALRKERYNLNGQIPTKSMMSGDSTSPAFKTLQSSNLRKVETSESMRIILNPQSRRRIVATLLYERRLRRQAEVQHRVVDK